MSIHQLEKAAIEEFFENPLNLTEGEVSFLTKFNFIKEENHLIRVGFYKYNESDFEEVDVPNKGDRAFAPLSYGRVIQSKKYAINDVVRLYDFTTRLYENPLFEAFTSASNNLERIGITPPRLTTRFWQNYRANHVHIDMTSSMGLVDYFTILVSDDDIMAHMIS